mmetsp:Transcript_9630/g.14261  ORF Transcript_9630/g.14261 Transcript_9630/m.14261 type:complete len:490 (+) Transcript_9630:144-1613(+)
MMTLQQQRKRRMCHNNHHYHMYSMDYICIMTFFLTMLLSPTALAFTTLSSKDAAFVIEKSNNCQLFKRSTSLSLSASAGGEDEEKKVYKHTLAILTVPRSSSDRIANEAILETAMSHTAKTPDAHLSIVLRGTAGSKYDGFTSNDNPGSPTLSQLRVHVGEIYSEAWDCAMAGDEKDEGRLVAPTALADIVVYPQNLPNAAPESWVSIRPDLDCVCSHDSIIGWVSAGAGGTGVDHKSVSGEGSGGLDSHVKAVNAERKSRGLKEVVALHVPRWPLAADVNPSSLSEIVFLEDEPPSTAAASLPSKTKEPSKGGGGLIGGVNIGDDNLYDSVAVGGTFDGMHYGHRKLLTLAVSSVRPITGKLLIGVTTDEMLKSKTFSNLIPPLKERMASVRNFVDALAPGMKDRMKIVPITDAFGPPGAPPSTDEHGRNNNDFDALVLSHETLETGYALNCHRVDILKMKPLTLLCTRRTEPHGMSSTALRRARSGE